MGVMASPLEIPVEADTRVDDFERWMAVEQRRVYMLCYRMLQDSDEADTATQDAFLKAYNALSKPDAERIGDRTKWLTRIAVNTCLDRLRSRSWKFWRRRPRPEDEQLILMMTRTKEPSAEDRLFAHQIERRIARALENLSPQQRAVFTLRHFEDRRLDEIAEIMGLEVGTVKAHMARALAKMRGLLQDLYLDRKSRGQAQGGS